MSIESRSRQYGKVFDHWQIREFLGSGSGGKSAVFRLVHSDSSSVQSALKVISLIEKRGNFDSLSEARKAEYARVKQKCKDHAKQEVLMMNGLQGRTNVVDYLDHTFVDWADGGSFGCDMLIRMELLNDLRSQIEDDHSFSQDEVLKIGRDICSALVLCHRKGILHRDIKPENIFYNEDGNYKLGDFGVSRILSAAPMSKASTGVCTPEYAAPEQMSGKYDTQVDIYSLGLVLYELSNSNLLPFASSTYITELEVQERMLGKALPAPQNASKAFASVILKACAFQPEDRYQTAEEFLADLNALSGVASRPVMRTLSIGNGTQKAAPAVGGNATQYAKPDIPQKNRENDTVYAKVEDSNPPPKSNKAAIFAVIAVVLAVLLIFTLGRDPKEEHAEDATSTPTTANVETESEADSVPETVHTHTWQDATCTQPKTCLDCGSTEGAPADHNWIAATCTQPKTCQNCGITEGEVTGHDWIAATTANPKTCRACGATEGSPILDIVTGDTLTMGYYGNESIVWTVLEFDPSTNQALLISKYCLDAISFHTGSDYGSWENSTLRKWLNNDFISTAFDQDERAAILTTNISTPQNPDYHIDSGGDTSDRVFLLSYDEAVYYFPSKTSRQAKPTAYCKEQGCYDPLKYAEEHGTEVSPEAIGYTWWWLRTAGLDEKHTCNVVAKGTASTYGAYKTSNEGGVRPAMWVQLGYQPSTEVPSTVTTPSQTDWIPLETKAMIDAGAFHNVYLRADGTVAAGGCNDKSKHANHGLRCDVSGWTDITMVSASTHTVGLRSDGTVIATGIDRYDQCSVSGWRNIVAVDAGDNHTLGLHSDGTVVAVGYNEFGQCDVRDWNNIVQISAGSETSYGLRENGTVVAAGSNRSGQRDVASWSNIKSISAGIYYIVGLKNNGTVVTAGLSEKWESQYSTWTDIVAVSAGSTHMVGLKADGTVVACGDNTYGQCDVGSWTDIAAVSVGMYHTLAMKKDGSLIAVGSNSYKQCEVSGWAA